MTLANGPRWPNGGQPGKSRPREKAMTQGLWGKRIVTAVLTIVIAAAAMTPVPAQERQKVVLVQGIRSMGFSSVFVALGKKYFEEEGLDVDFQILRGDAVTFQAVVSRSAEFAAVGGNEMITSSSKGLKGIVAVASVAAAVTVSIVVRKDIAEARNLNPSLPFEQRFVGLKGLTLAVGAPGGAIHTVIMHALRSVNIDPTRDVTIVHLNSPDQMLAALSAKQIDGFAISPPAAETAEANGTGVVLVKFAEGGVPALSNIVYDALVTRQDYADQHPDVVRKMVRAIGRACNLLRENPDEAFYAIHPFFDKTPPEVMKVAVNNVRNALAPHGLFTEEAWKNTMDFNIKAGKIKTPLDTREGVLWTNKYNAAAR